MYLLINEHQQAEVLVALYEHARDNPYRKDSDFPIIWRNGKEAITIEEARQAIIDETDEFSERWFIGCLKKVSVRVQYCEKGEIDVELFDAMYGKGKAKEILDAKNLIRSPTPLSPEELEYIQSTLQYFIPTIKMILANIKDITYKDCGLIQCQIDCVERRIAEDVTQQLKEVGFTVYTLSPLRHIKTYQVTITAPKTVEELYQIVETTLQKLALTQNEITSSEGSQFSNQ